MTSFTARIVLEGWGDQTVELDQYERDQIIVQIGSAMARKRAEDERREQEEAKARASKNDAFTSDEAFDWTQWAGIFDRFSRASSSSFGRFATHPTSTPPPAPTPRFPRDPVTVTDALDVVSFWSEDAYRKTPDALRALLRKAKRKTHPDTGGTAVEFQRVTAAEEILRRAGRI